MRRAVRLEASFRATGDLRQWKRAKRLRRQIHKATMRRVSDAFRAFGSSAGAFAAALANVGSAAAKVGQRLRDEADARLRRETTAIDMMMRDHPDLSAADAQRIYRMGGAQLMTKPLTFVDFADGPMLPAHKAALEAYAVKSTASERHWRRIYQVDVGSRVRPKVPFDAGDDIDENDPATRKAIDLMQRRRREFYDDAVLRAIAPPRNPR
jgi:hypothetical protein